MSLTGKIHISFVQKRALSVICPNLSYCSTLESLEMEPLADHHKGLCESLFDGILEDKAHRQVCIIYYRQIIVLNTP